MRARLFFPIAVLVMLSGFLFFFLGKKDDGQGASPTSLALTGDIDAVHDPMAIKIRDTYYIFSSGENIQVRTSPDLLNWSYVGDVFDGTPPRPSWIDQTIPDNQGIWAPDVSFFGTTYHLYYSFSRGGGSTVSCIGHATYDGSNYVDRGRILCSNVDNQVNWNALDPNVVLDENGTPWLAFGSWLTGLRMIKLNSDGSYDGGKIYPIARRSRTEGIEASFIVRHGGYYYLFSSWDKCCRGIRSTYNIRVGRSTNVAGPYYDKSGVPLLNGGGSLVLKGSLRLRGPGHNAILFDDGKAYNVYHAYDTYRLGESVLRIAEMTFDADGWPVSGGP